MFTFFIVLGPGYIMKNVIFLSPPCLLHIISCLHEKFKFQNAKHLLLLISVDVPPFRRDFLVCTLHFPYCIHVNRFLARPACFIFVCF